MNKHLKELRKVESEVFDNMGEASQIIIDFIEDITSKLDRDVGEEPIERDELGAINYDIDILLEVFDTKREYDIETLKIIDRIIEDWGKDIEFVNIALGIPRDKG